MESMEIAVNWIISFFGIIILFSLVLFLINDKKYNNQKKGQFFQQEEKESIFKISDNKDVEAEAIKAIQAIENGIIANEKQVNHAKKHDDKREVENFEHFVEHNFFDINIIGDTIYGKH